MWSSRDSRSTRDASKAAQRKAEIPGKGILFFPSATICNTCLFTSCHLGLLISQKRREQCNIWEMNICWWWWILKAFLRVLITRGAIKGFHWFPESNTTGYTVLYRTVHERCSTTSSCERTFSWILLTSNANGQQWGYAAKQSFPKIHEAVVKFCRECLLGNRKSLVFYAHLNAFKKPFQLYYASWAVWKKNILMSQKKGGLLMCGGRKSPTKRLTDVPIYSICQLIPHSRKKLSCICRI